MNGVRRSLVCGVSFAVLAAVACIPVAAAADPGGVAPLADRITEIGLRIERRLEAVRHDAARGHSDRSHLARDVERAGDDLDRLAVRIGLLPAAEREPLLSKIDSIRHQLDNLRRAAASPATVPPGPPATRTVHKARDLAPTEATPVNDTCSAAFPVGLGTFVGSTAEATNDGEATCGASIYSPDIWYRYIADSSGYVVFDTVGSGYDAVLSVHSGCPGTIANQMTCNDDSLGLQASVRISTNAGSEYLVRVSGFDGASGTAVLNITTGGGISGVVTDRTTSTPISGAKVELYDRTGYYLGSDYTGASGGYGFSALASGEFYLGTDIYSSAYIDQLYNGHPCPGGPPYGCDPTSGDPVTVVSGSAVSGIEFALDRGGSLAGRVTDAGTTAAVEGARVAAYRADGSSAGYDYTDSAGDYVIQGLDAGTYFAVVTSDLYADEAYDDIPCPGGPPYGCDPTLATAIPVQLNTTTGGVDFALDRAGGITGTVIERDGSGPVPYPEVRVYDSTGSYVAYADSESDGTYQVGGLPDGRYYVTASGGYSSVYVAQLYDGIDCPSSGCDVTSGTPVDIVQQSTVSGIDFDLVRRGSITGTVRDETTFLPLSGVRVRVYNDAGSSVEYDSTDSAGVFELTGLAQGTYFVATDTTDFVDVLYDDLPCHPSCDPTTGTPVAVVNGATTGGVNFDIVPLGKITGTVVEQGTGSTIAARVRLYDSAGGYLTYDYTYDGEYSFAGLETGSFFLVGGDYYSNAHLEELYDDIPCWGGAPDGCDVTTGTPVPAIVSVVTSGIDFSLQRKGSISGTVVDGISSSPLSGTVYVEDLGGDVVASDSVYSGDYLVEGLVPGSYRVIADTGTHLDEVWDDIPCAGEYPDMCDTTTGTPLVVGAGTELDGIDFALAPLGSISGTVRDAVDQSPLPYFTVLLFDDSGEAVAYDYSGYSDGLYEFPGLWPGTYHVATDEDGITHFDQLYQGIPCPGGPPNGCDPTTGTDLDIGFGSVLAGVDFDLERTGAVSGVVVAEDTGQPLPSCTVQVWTDGGTQVRSSYTDSHGMYTVRGLSPGSYYVATREFGTSNPDYIDELFDDIPCLGGPPGGCDPTKGTPVEVVSNQTARFVDFALSPRHSGFAGAVVDADTGQPLPGIRIDVWSTADGDFELSTVTSAAGTYRADLPGGAYAVATDNPGSWLNEVFDGIECPGGSAYNGDCDPMTGDPVVVVDGQLTAGVDFDLRSNDVLFMDGFETGDTAAWSLSVP